MRASLQIHALLLLGLAAGAPEVAARAPAVADGSLSAVRDTLVIVRRGQSLSQVVMRHFLESDYATAHEMLDWTRYHNRLISDVLITGQSLRIPLGPLSLDSRSTTAQDSTIVPDAMDGETVRGIYINVRRSGQRGAIRLARRLKEAGGNAIVFDIKDRDGMLTYDSRVDFAVDVDATREAVIADPSVFVQHLKELGLHVIARLVCFQDAHLASSRPDLVPLTAAGQAWTQHGSSKWVDPVLPEVQGYLFELMKEAAAMGVDELQLDYVRFPTVAAWAHPEDSQRRAQGGVAELDGASPKQFYKWLFQKIRAGNPWLWDIALTALISLYAREVGLSKEQEKKLRFRINLEMNKVKVRVNGFKGSSKRSPLA